VDPERQPITVMLRRLSASGGTDPQVADQLFEAVYGELRRISAGLMRRERREHTLEPTALVHEAYLRLVGPATVAWEDRGHFFGIAARVMRQVLVDHARRRRALRRGGEALRITLVVEVYREGLQPTDVLELNDLLEALAGLDPRGARVVELKVFGGLTTTEIGEVLGISKRTVDDDWSVAKMWLRRRLKKSGGR
jgi:RNA polymerase sigma factor (TIGR02999 family)